MKSERKRFTGWIACCSFWNFALTIVIALLILLFVFKGQLFGHETSDPGNVTIPYVGIPESNMSVFGIYTINETALINDEKIRFIDRYENLPSHGLEPSLTSPCVRVEHSGLYKVDSQITFTFAPRISNYVLAKHTLEVRNDVTDKHETVTKRQISAPEDVLTSHRPYQAASNIAHLTPANAGDSICISTRPTKNVYTKKEENVLNIELKFKMPIGSDDIHE